MLNLDLRKILGRWDIILFLLSIEVCIVWPELDLAITKHFYYPALGGFPIGDWYIFKDLYYLFGKCHIFTALLLLGLIVYFSVNKNPPKRKIAAYLLCVLVIGPGLVVNLWLKDNSIGRARPREVIEFGGTHAFTPAFYNAQACDTNCSFPCGHAASGFYLVALAWAFRRRSLLLVGIGLGGLLGFMRIVQGGHFASDVLISFWVCYFCAMLLAKLFGLADPFESSSEKLAPLRSQFEQQ
jgi:lipid A 4'-phosphatase